MTGQSIPSLVLKVVPLGTGVAAAVLGLIGTATVAGKGTPLGIGLVCLALWALQDSN